MSFFPLSETTWVQRRRLLTGLAVVVIGAVLGLAVSACSTSTDTVGTYKQYSTHETINGRRVDCVALRTTHGASITCNWDAYNGK
jgi:hypothetical protein